MGYEVAIVIITIFHTSHMGKKIAWSLSSRDADSTPIKLLLYVELYKR